MLNRDGTGKRVVIFGAGSTGRGHVGQLAHASGYQLVFVDRDAGLVQRLVDAKRYTVRLVGAAIRDVLVDGYEAYSLIAEEAIAEAVAHSDLVLTAVRAENLSGVVRPLTLGIARRAQEGIKTPLNIVACENMIGGSTTLKALVMRELDPSYRWQWEYLGFPDAMISRVVPVPQGDQMLLEAEDYNEWPVDRESYLGDDPQIAGLDLVDNLPALLERKLFLHNTGHAVCGYLGWLKGYTVMCDAILDPWIRNAVHGAMTESGQALIHRHGFSEQSIWRYRDGFIPRVEGRLIQDAVSRVIRDPVRKLGRNERLVGPACMALDYGIMPHDLALGIAALLRYDSAEDQEALALQAMLRGHDLRYALHEVAGVDLQRHGALLELVRAASENLP
jgi:mannitol-1-phosphate 5-dehydrogenase